MNTLKILIVDDEQDCREVLCKLIERLFPEAVVTGMAASAETAYQLVLETHPDLVFLDIQMPRQDGFSLLKRFQTVPFEVIFVTSYDEYALAAIKFNALDYLLKPVDLQELKQAVMKILKPRSPLQEQQKQYTSLLHHLEGNKKDRRMAVHHGEKVKLLNEKDILFVEAERRYSHIYMINGEHYTMARSLGEFEEYFGPDSAFIRLSKTFIVNSSYIKEYSKGGIFIIEMLNGKVFEVSRRKKPEVLEKLKRLM